MAWVVESFHGSLAGMARFAWWVLVATGRAFVESWNNATWRKVWFGLPFALAAVGSLFLVTLARGYARSGQVTDRYVDAGRRALREKRFKAADVYFERVLNLRGGYDNDTLFAIAQAADRMGNSERADTILRMLAPVEQPRYAPAHLWRAERIIAKKTLTPEEILDAHTHLRYAVELEPNNLEAHRRLGIFYLNRKQWRPAVEHLEKAARRYPELYLPLARCHTILGNKDLARFYGKQAIEFHASRCKASPRDLRTRVQWADALVFLEQFPQAVQVLEEGLALQHDVLLRKALSRVYIVWSDSIRGDSEADAVKRLGLLEAAISAFPHEGPLFDRLMRLMERGDKATESAKEFLVQRIARGDAPRLCHLVLGTYEGKEGHYEKAIRHLEQAYELDKSSPIVANNLAWYMLQAGTIDLEKAYQLVSKLAARWPMMAAIHETRGQILARMGRWKEALREFERALPDVRGNAQTHRTLAEVYRHLNMPRLAREHARLAEETEGVAQREK